MQAYTAARRSVAAASTHLVGALSDAVGQVCCYSACRECSTVQRNHAVLPHYKFDANSRLVSTHVSLPVDHHLSTARERSARVSSLTQRTHAPLGDKPVAETRVVLLIAVVAGAMAPTVSMPWLALPFVIL